MTTEISIPEFLHMELQKRREEKLRIEGAIAELETILRSITVVPPPAAVEEPKKRGRA